MSEIKTEVGICSICGDEQEIVNKGTDYAGHDWIMCRICYILGAQEPRSRDANATVTVNQTVAIVARLARILLRQV